MRATARYELSFFEFRSNAAVPHVVDSNCSSSSKILAYLWLVKLAYEYSVVVLYYKFSIEIRIRKTQYLIFDH